MTGLFVNVVKKSMPKKATKKTKATKKKTEVEVPAKRISKGEVIANIALFLFIIGCIYVLSQNLPIK